MARSPASAERRAPARAGGRGSTAPHVGDLELVAWAAVGLALASTGVLTWVGQGAGAGLGGLALADLVVRSSIAPGWVAWALRAVVVAGAALVVAAPCRTRSVALARALGCSAGAVALPLAVEPSRWGPGAAVAMAALAVGAALGLAGLPGLAGLGGASGARAGGRR